jgi:uncharacterized membrane protein YeaQ/YmgE (transglycosylase-associated protein family)
MWWNVVVFALIGAFAGGAARVFYPGRETMKMLGTVLLGVAGALAGGLLSWAFWPAAADEIHTGALVVSVLGAVLALVLWPSWFYWRSISGRAGSSA